MGDLISTTFEDFLKVEGINYKGFGVLPKYVMLDTDISAEAKAIYAYFCSYAGNGSSAFPSRSRILSELKVGKEAYYNHFPLLVQEGYIVVEREQGGGIKGKNIYTLVSNPKKFEEQPDDSKKNLAYSRIRFNGLKAAGFGMIPKAVMIDERLPLKAKAIYAYFCSFAGSGNSAFPKLNKILYHLQIAEATYYKFYNMLKEKNYITTVQRRVQGRMDINDYYLNEFPDAAEIVETTDITAFSPIPKNPDIVAGSPIPKNPDIVAGSPIPKNPDIVNPDITKPIPKNPDITNPDVTINKVAINNSNKNNVYYNHSLTQKQPAQPEQSEGEILTDDDIFLEVKTAILKERQLPYWYCADDRRLTAAIHFMTDWDTFYPNGYKYELEQAVYNLFNEALISMCQTEKMTLKGALVTYAKVIDKINALAEFTDSYVDLSEFADVARQNYKEAARDKEIKNPLQYMKSCIWDAMITGRIQDVAYFDGHYGSKVTPAWEEKEREWKAQGVLDDNGEPIISSWFAKK